MVIMVILTDNIELSPCYFHVFELSPYNVDDDVAQFPPKIGSDFSASTNRTTNSCESFHAKLNGFCHSGHPNILILVDTLLSIQS